MLDHAWELGIRYVDAAPDPKGRGSSALQDVVDNHGATVDAVAIAAAVGQPLRPLVLSGATTAGHLDANVAGLDLDLDADDLDRLATLAEPREQYWATRDDLAWT